MRLGVHIAIAQGFEVAIRRAERIGCESIQFFSSNPNSWRVSTVAPKSVEALREGVERLGLRPITLHTPYLINLAGPKELVWEQSSILLAAALDRATLLGADYVVTHIGSHGGTGFEVGADRVAVAVGKSLDASPGTPMLLLEAGSGSGSSIGSKFEELAVILDRLDDRRERVGVCLDTAHLWGAGYDLSTLAGVDSVLGQFDELIGLPRLKVFHLNDTQKALGSRADRHWHIGKGQVGLDGFRAIVNHPALVDVAGIMETPDSESGMDAVNLGILKGLRGIRV